MNLYCKINFFNATDDLILSLGATIFLAKKLVHFLSMQFDIWPYLRRNIFQMYVFQAPCTLDFSGFWLIFIWLID